MRIMRSSILNSIATSISGPWMHTRQKKLLHCVLDDSAGYLYPSTLSEIIDGSIKTNQWSGASYDWAGHPSGLHEVYGFFSRLNTNLMGVLVRSDVLIWTPNDRYLNLKIQGSIIRCQRPFNHECVGANARPKLCVLIQFAHVFSEDLHFFDVRCSSAVIILSTCLPVLILLLSTCLPKLLQF